MSNPFILCLQPGLEHGSERDQAGMGRGHLTRGWNGKWEWRAWTCLRQLVGGLDLQHHV